MGIYDRISLTKPEERIILIKELIMIIILNYWKDIQAEWNTTERSRMNYSRQREAVKEQLKLHHDHPTADLIFAELREKDPNISLATVYRNLKLLSEVGEIQKLSFVSGADHFDPNTSNHYHFVCDRCGRIFDVPIEVTKDLDMRAEDFLPAEITGHELVFHGICDDCREKQAV